MTTTTTNKKSNIAIILAIIGVIISGILLNKWNKSVVSKRDQTSFINSLYDTIKTLREDNMSKTVRIGSLQMQTSSQFINLKIKDSQIEELQAVVKLYGNKLKSGSSVTNTTVNTHINKTNPNEYIGDLVDSCCGVISLGDSAYKGWILQGNNNNYIVRIPYSNPYFLSKYSDKWINLEVKTYRDSTNTKIDITNSYSVILGYDKKTPFADVINYNPYSTITKLRAFQVTVPRQKDWGIGINAGVGFSYDLRPRPYIGIGVSYNLIKF